MHRSFGVTTPNHLIANIYDWIALLLFPVGISLRLVKTSLELFGGLT
jgi:hypothetical protein